MILGVGIDLCEIARMEAALEKPRFAERVFTPAERARLDAVRGKRRAEVAAGLFAAKEAVAKALGTGFVGFGPWDVEIVPDPAGRPVCRLLNGAAALAEGGEWTVHVSITHENGAAAAVAVAEKR